jgi:hypothetical protein
MAYSPTNWIDGSTLVGSFNMNKIESGLVAAEEKALKGTANGYASLDASTLVPLAQIPVLGASKIGTDAVTATQIATDAVGAAEIAAGAVGTAEIADNAVTSAKIPPDAVGAAQIAANAVGASEIADGSVGTAELANNAVTAAKFFGLPVAALYLTAAFGTGDANFRNPGAMSVLMDFGGPYMTANGGGGSIIFNDSNGIYLVVGYVHPELPIPHGASYSVGCMMNGSVGDLPGTVAYESYTSPGGQNYNNGPAAIAVHLVTPSAGQEVLVGGWSNWTGNIGFRLYAVRLGSH